MLIHNRCSYGKYDATIVKFDYSMISFLNLYFVLRGLDVEMKYLLYSVIYVLYHHNILKNIFVITNVILYWNKAHICFNILNILNLMQYILGLIIYKEHSMGMIRLFIWHSIIVIWMLHF